jgi:hypothetical protein
MLVWNIFYKPLLFVADNVQTLPLPVLLSIAIPALLSYMKYSTEDTSVNGRRIAWLLLAVWLIGYILIAAAFAPSVYGQSYPAARARFSGVVLLTVMFMLTGMLLGRLAAPVKFLRSPAIQIGIMTVFVLISLYPLRTTWRLSAEIPVYQQRAILWDARDAEIRASKAEGVTDITVHFLSEDAVQDLGDRREFRLNRCAASLYDVNSILAIPRRKE